MRVVMLGPFGLRPKGTMLRRALPMGRAMARRGHEVVVLMPPWHRPEDADRSWRDEVVGLRLEYVSLAGLGWPGLGHVVVAGRMARRAMRLEPDLVHAFKPKAYSGLAAMMLSWARRLPAAPRPAIVVDTDDWEGPGGWNDLEPYSRAQRRVFAWQERAGLSRHADAVTVASRALGSLVWSLGVSRDRTCYLPNAIDDALPGAPGGEVAADEASVASSPVGLQRPFTLLLYTRFFEFELARPLEVLASLRATHPEARLVVGGQGLFGEEQRFMALAERMGLGDAVEDLGWIAPEDLASFLDRGDVALYPFDDTLVNRTKSAFKLLELMDAGLPVVAEAVGQNRAVIEDRRSGRLVPAGEVETFAEALRELADDRALRHRMGQAARERIRDHYLWSLQAEALEAVYAAAIEGLRLATGGNGR